MLKALSALLLASLPQPSAVPWTVAPSGNGSCTMRTVSVVGNNTRDLRFLMARDGKITIELRRSDWEIAPRSLAQVAIGFDKPASPDESTFWFSLKNDLTGLEGTGDDAMLDRLAATKALSFREDVLAINETIDTTGAADAVDRLRACAG